MEDYSAENSEQIEKIVDNLKDRLRKIGLYLDHAAVLTDSDDEALREHGTRVVDAIKSGDAHFALVAFCTVGDLAWDLRTQDPSQFEVDQQFREIMPTEAELKRDEIQQKMREKGGTLADDDIFGLFDEDPDAKE